MLHALFVHAYKNGYCECAMPTYLEVKMKHNEAFGKAQICEL